MGENYQLTLNFSSQKRPEMSKPMPNANLLLIKCLTKQPRCQKVPFRRYLNFKKKCWPELSVLRYC